jgi:hypothetical protein
MGRGVARETGWGWGGEFRLHRLAGVKEAAEHVGLGGQVLQHHSPRQPVRRHLRPRPPQQAPPRRGGEGSEGAAEQARGGEGETEERAEGGAPAAAVEAARAVAATGPATGDAEEGADEGGGDDGGGGRGVEEGGAAEVAAD